MKILGRNGNHPAPRPPMMERPEIPRPASDGWDVSGFVVGLIVLAVGILFFLLLINVWG